MHPYGARDLQIPLKRLRWFFGARMPGEILLRDWESTALQKETGIMQMVQSSERIPVEPYASESPMPSTSRTYFENPSDNLSNSMSEGSETQGVEICPKVADAGFRRRVKLLEFRS